MSDKIQQIIEFYEEIGSWVDELEPGELYALVPKDARNAFSSIWEDPDDSEALSAVREYVKSYRVEQILRSDSYRDWKRHN